MIHPVWRTTRFHIDLRRPQVMGIVNATPDSFSDGGRFDDASTALLHCEKLVKAGADLLDIGGESTRPGAAPVPLDEELRRILPVVRGAMRLGVPVAVDTSKAGVMRAVLDLGVDVVNDVWALRQPGALDAVAAHPACGVCLMHMHGEPGTMQTRPMTGDVVAAVHQFLSARSQAAHDAGIAAERLVLDPGIGFGKTVAQNFALLARQADAVPVGYPVLVGWSRKSSLGTAVALAAGERMVPSVAAALLAVERGARIVRVHDVGPTVAALAIRNAMQNASAPVADRALDGESVPDRSGASHATPGVHNRISA